MLIITHIHISTYTYIFNGNMHTGISIIQCIHILKNTYKPSLSYPTHIHTLVYANIQLKYIKIHVHIHTIEYVYCTFKHAYIHCSVHDVHERHTCTTYIIRRTNKYIYSQILTYRFRYSIN